MKPLVALALLAVAIGCTDHDRGKPAGPLRVVNGSTTGFGLNGRRIAWEEAGGRIVVADLDSGRRVSVAKGGGESRMDMALAGSTVLWLDISGGNVREDALITASPGGHRKVLAKWYEETSASAPIGTLFGGVAGKGGMLAFGLYRLSPQGRNADACYDKPCRRHVSGGGTFTVTPGSLTLHRVLPPAQAVAAGDHLLAAAVLRKGALYSGKAQLVVKDLWTGRRRAIGARASIQAVALDRNRVGALIQGEDGFVHLLRVWDVTTGKLVRSVHVDRPRPVLSLSGSIAVLGSGPFFTVNVRTGRRHAFVGGGYGPWVTRGRLLWVETRDDGEPTARSVIRSAPLPGAAG